MRFNGSVNRLAAPVLAIALVAAGCTASEPESSGTTITVYAAASLKESFDELADSYQKAHLGTTVHVVYGGSSTLANQIAQGAPVDLFAAANTLTMSDVVTTGRAHDPVVFARNSLQIAVPPGNPAHITSLHDLGRGGVTLALCQPKVPCGTSARRILSKAEVTVHPASEEADVKGVLTKVRMGEADAGIVYVTDVRAAGSAVRGIAVPAEVQMTTDYPIVTLSDSPHAAAARDFQAWVTGATGRDVLRVKGFQLP